jgi:hypothetical protein
MSPLKNSLLASLALLALVSACGSPTSQTEGTAISQMQQEQEPDQEQLPEITLDQPTTVSLKVSLGEAPTSRGLARTAVGGFDEIERLYINAIRQGRGGYVYAQPGTSLTRNATSGLWEGQLDGFILGANYQFYASARKADDTELFTGETSHTITSNSNLLTFNLTPNLNDAEIAIPVILGVTLPETVGEGLTIPVEATVNVADAGTLRWSFESYKTGFFGLTLPCSEDCGSFSPSWGNSSYGISQDVTSTAEGYSHILSTEYTAPDKISDQYMKLVVKNSAGVGVATRFSVIVTGPTDTEVALNAAPTIMSIIAERIQDSTACPELDCLAIQAQVQDDGSFDNLSAAWSYLPSSGNHSFPYTLNEKGSSETEGSLFAVLKGYHSSDAGEIELVVTDKDGTGLSSQITFPLVAYAYPLDNIVCTDMTGCSTPKFGTGVFGIARFAPAQ